MKKLEITKEVVYRFSYNNNTVEEYHFVDNITGKRYRNYINDSNYVVPLNFQGTGADETIIDAELIAVNEEGEYTLLMYYLSDIDIYVFGRYIYYEFEQDHSFSLYYL